MSIAPYLPRGWVCVPCPGAAHANPHIDNCGLCAPLWGELVLPASAPTREAWIALRPDTHARLKRARARAIRTAKARRLSAQLAGGES